MMTQVIGFFYPIKVVAFMNWIILHSKVKSQVVGISSITYFNAPHNGQNIIRMIFQYIETFKHRAIKLDIHITVQLIELNLT